MDILVKATEITIRPGRDVFLYQHKHASEDVPTIFLVHGACASMTQFASIIEVLKEKYSIVTYDLYGCGNSPKPESWSAYATEEHKSDLFAVYKHFASKVNFAIGHSFGSSLVMSLASVGSVKHLHGMVLIGSTASMGEAPIIFKLPVWVLNCLQSTLSRDFVRRAYTSSASQKLKDGCLALCNQNPMFMCKAFYQQAKWIKEDKIRFIPDPALIIHGKDDQILPLSGAEKLSKTLPMSKIEVIENASHLVIEEHPEKVVSLVENFLGEVIEERKTDKLFIYLGESADSYSTNAN
mmetsp:Transcript_12231/g.15874  ORF Transcript_12231/g.15874 Transcript_12231/m.15874 type:complete len:295 (+) Transcript_12231:19-903(+)